MTRIVTRIVILGGEKSLSDGGGGASQQLGEQRAPLAFGVVPPGVLVKVGLQVARATSCL